MGSNIYNSKDDEKFARLINDLKNLPKEKADDNFEFNLMVKIRNKNFELSHPESRFNFGRPLVPAAALVFSTIILFFILSDSGVNLENPFQTSPPLRSDYSVTKTDTIVLSKAAEVQVQNMEEELAQPTAQNNQNLVRVVVQPSDAVTVEDVELPFDDSNSLDLDSYVKGNRTQQASLNRGRLVSGGTQPTQFNGFLVKERPSKKVIESHREKLDSLKNAEKTDKK